MPTYFFNVTDGHTDTIDDEGTEFGNEQAALLAAMQEARALMADSDASGFCRRHWRMNVVDKSGGSVFSMPFEHALEPSLLIKIPGQQT